MDAHGFRVLMGSSTILLYLPKGLRFPSDKERVFVKICIKKN